MYSELTHPPLIMPGSARPAREELLAGGAFERFYSETATSLVAYLRGMTRDAQLAEDLAQEAYLRLLTSNAPAPPEGITKAYLYRVATHLVIDRSRRLRLEDTWRRWRRRAASEITPDPRSSRALDLERAMSKLRPKARALLWLAHVEGFSHAEIASVVGLREASVRVILFRARSKMRRLLGNDSLVEESS